MMDDPFIPLHPSMPSPFRGEGEQGAAGHVTAFSPSRREAGDEDEDMWAKILPVLAALLTWALVLCAIFIVVGPRGTLVDDMLDGRTLVLVSGLAVALTLGLALPRVPSVAGYLVAHLAGIVLLLGVLRGLGLLTITFPLAAFPWGL